jgi:integrase
LTQRRDKADSKNAAVTILSDEKVRLLLSQPGASTAEGLRDTLYMTLLYETAAGADAIGDIRIADISKRRFCHEITVKGGQGEPKSRTFRLAGGDRDILESYLDCFHRGMGGADRLFYSEKLTKRGGGRTAPIEKRMMIRRVQAHAEQAGLAGRGEPLPSAARTLAHSRAAKDILLGERREDVSEKYGLGKEESFRVWDAAGALYSRLRRQKLRAARADKLEGAKGAMKHHRLILSREGVKAVLAQANQGTPTGRFSLFLMVLLYETGCAVTELLNLRISDFSADAKGLEVKFSKSGGAPRSAALSESTARGFARFLGEFHKSSRPGDFLFDAQALPAKQEMGPKDVRKILQFHLNKARNILPKLPERITDSTFRLTRAIHRLEDKATLEETIEAQGLSWSEKEELARLFRAHLRELGKGGGGGAADPPNPILQYGAPDARAEAAPEEYMAEFLRPPYGLKAWQTRTWLVANLLADTWAPLDKILRMKASDAGDGAHARLPDGAGGRRRVELGPASKALLDACRVKYHQQLDPGAPLFPGSRNSGHKTLSRRTIELFLKRRSEEMSQTRPGGPPLVTPKMITATAAVSYFLRGHTAAEAASRFAVSMAGAHELLSLARSWRASGEAPAEEKEAAKGGGVAKAAKKGPGKAKAAARGPGKAKEPARGPGRAKAAVKSPGKAKAAVKSPGKTKAAAGGPGKAKEPERAPGKAKAAARGPGKAKAAKKGPGKERAAERGDGKGKKAP